MGKGAGACLGRPQPQQDAKASAVTPNSGKEAQEQPKPLAPTTVVASSKVPATMTKKIFVIYYCEYIPGRLPSL